MATKRRGSAATGRTPRTTAGKGGKAPRKRGKARELGAEQTTAVPPNQTLVSSRERAAFHLDTAAHHHSQAGRYRSQGFDARAYLHNHSAKFHGEQAKEYGDPEAQRRDASEVGRIPHSRRGF